MGRGCTGKAGAHQVTVPPATQGTTVLTGRGERQKTLVLLATTATVVTPGLRNVQQAITTTIGDWPQTLARRVLRGTTVQQHPWCLLRVLRVLGVGVGTLRLLCAMQGSSTPTCSQRRQLLVGPVLQDTTVQKAPSDLLHVASAPTTPTLEGRRLQTAQHARLERPVLT